MNERKRAGLWPALRAAGLSVSALGAVLLGAAALAALLPGPARAAETGTPMPTVGGFNNHAIYANGAPLLIAAGEGGGTTVYIDRDGDGVLDDGELSLKTADIENAPEDGADLIDYNIYGGGETAVTGPTRLTMTGGKVGMLYGGGQAQVNGDTKLTMTGGKVNSLVGGGFGGGGAVTGTATVSVKGGTVGQVLNGGGGGTTGAVSVSVTGGRVERLNGGGGNSAVTGGVAVTVTGGTVGNLYGGGYTGTVSGGVSITVSGVGSVYTLYGGGEGENATVSDGVSVAVTGGRVGTLYGGGAGKNATVSGDVTVTVGGGAWVGYYPTDQGVALNGGAGGNKVTNGVDAFKIDPALTVTGTVKVWLPEGYGASLPDKIAESVSADAAAADLERLTLAGPGAAGLEAYQSGSEIRVRRKPPTVEGDSASASVYANGAALRIVAGTGDGGSGKYTNILYDIDGNGVIGTEEYLKIGNSEPTAAGYDLSGCTIYGGGKTDAVDGASITMEGGAVGTLYGGGRDGQVTGGATVTMEGGAVDNLYGGGHKAQSTVTGGAKVTVTGGKVLNLCGGGHEAESTVKGGAAVTMEGGEVVFLYGGGMTGAVEGGAEVTMTGGTVKGDLYGGGHEAQSTVTGGAAVTVTGGTVKTLYGGGCSKGSTVTGTVRVTVGGSAQVGGDSDRSANGVVLNGGTGADAVANGVDAFAIDPALAEGGTVKVWLPEGYDASRQPKIATGAAAGDLNKLTLAGPGAPGLLAYLDGTDIRVKGGAAPGGLITGGASAQADALAALGGAGNASVSGAGSVLTLTLRGDVTLTGTNLGFQSGEYVLDLNGHTLSGDFLQGGCVQAGAGATLTVKDSAGGGGIENASTAAVIALNGSTLTVEGGTFRGGWANTGEGGAVRTYPAAQLSCGSTAVLKGGVFRAGAYLEGDDQDAWSMSFGLILNTKQEGYPSDTPTQLTFDLSAQGACFETDGIRVAEGGDAGFVRTAMNGLYYSKQDDTGYWLARAAVSGGALNLENDIFRLYGGAHAAEYSWDGGTTWTKTASLRDAFLKAVTQSASGSDSPLNRVRLLGDCDLSYSQGGPINVTVDLNGFRWTGEGDEPPLKLMNGATATVTDGRGGGGLLGRDATETTAASPAVLVAEKGGDPVRVSALILTGDKPFTLRGGDGSAQQRAGAGISVKGGADLSVLGTGAILIRGGDGVGGNSNGGDGVDAVGAGSITLSNAAARLQGGDGSDSNGNGGSGCSCKNGGTVRVTGGTLAGGATFGINVRNQGLFVGKDAAAVLSGGTFTGGESFGGVSRGVSGGAGVDVQAGALTVTGGTFTGGRGHGTHAGAGGAGGKVYSGSFSITGGDFTGGALAAESKDAGTVPGPGLDLSGAQALAPLSGVTCTGGDGSTSATGDDLAPSCGLYAYDTALTITGGTFTGGRHPASCGARLQGGNAACAYAVEGGAFSGKTRGLEVIGDSTMTVTLSGGRFTGDGAEAWAVDAGKRMTAGALLAEGCAYYDGGRKLTAGLDGRTLGQNATLEVSDRAPDPGPGPGPSGGDDDGPTGTTNTGSTTGGKKTETQVNPDGSKTTTVTDAKTGAVTETTVGKNGVETVVQTQKDGSAQAQITVPAAAAQPPEGGGLPLVEVPGPSLPAGESAGPAGSGGPAVRVKLPERLGTPVIVALPVEDGTVVLRVEPDGSETPIPLSLVEDGRAYVLLETDETLRIQRRDGYFEDVTGAAARAADFGAARGLWTGTGEKRFDPTLSTSRAMLAAVLWRLDGTRTVGAGAQARFPDVASDDWFAPAAAWGAATGVVQGTGAGFGPAVGLTLEQAVVMLHRYADYAGLLRAPEGAADAGKPGAGSQNADTPDAGAAGEDSQAGGAALAAASPWARGAVAWAVGEGLLDPADAAALADPVTRAGMARLLEAYVRCLVTGGVRP